MTSPTPSLILFQTPGRPWGMPNLSPFAAKLETYLRLARWPYEIKPASFSQAPKGKVPYVELDGRRVGDSQFIIEMLEARRPAEQRLDSWLSDRQRAVGHAVRRMLDEGTYFVLVHRRWLDDQAWPVFRPRVAELVGPAKFLLPLIRNGVRKANRSQGTSRHTAEEIDRIGIADFTALAEIIADNRWLLGDRPTAYDASAYAFIEGIAAPPLGSRLREFVLAEPRLMDYRNRVREAHWSELRTA